MKLTPTQVEALRAADTAAKEAALRECESSIRRQQIVSRGGYAIVSAIFAFLFNHHL